MPDHAGLRLEHPDSREWPRVHFELVSAYHQESVEVTTEGLGPFFDVVSPDLNGVQRRVVSGATSEEHRRGGFSDEGGLVEAEFVDLTEPIGVVDEDLAVGDDGVIDGVDRSPIAEPLTMRVLAAC
jgi:hypothetical protein